LVVEYAGCPVPLLTVLDVCREPAGWEPNGFEVVFIPKGVLVVLEDPKRPGVALV
jgi:hypothetical protein